MGSWLEGPPTDPAEESGLGLPADGPGSLARLPRRFVALLVDWFLSLAVSGLLFPEDGAARGILAGDRMATLAVFGISSAVLVGLLGHTIGHRLAGLRVIRLRDGRAPGLVAGLVRSALLVLVIPAVVWGRDGRGLHDVLAGTAIVRR
ncbi:hypothetical protein N867_01820 [Actinotalea fermentans ATCC 43279 = JCM 9966 = DSM 3133]|nr:hypothetical protein N867_01820 [Actinotalea fermentans ATCC 43279 = JCM 9966 = DSM 3133]